MNIFASSTNRTTDEDWTSEYEAVFVHYFHLQNTIPIDKVEPVPKKPVSFLVSLMKKILTGSGTHDPGSVDDLLDQWDYKVLLTGYQDVIPAMDKLSQILFAA